MSKLTANVQYWANCLFNDMLCSISFDMCSAFDELFLRQMMRDCEQDLPSEDGESMKPLLVLKVWFV